MKHSNNIAQFRYTEKEWKRIQALASAMGVSEEEACERMARAVCNAVPRRPAEGLRVPEEVNE